MQYLSSIMYLFRSIGKGIDFNHFSNTDFKSALLFILSNTPGFVSGKKKCMAEANCSKGLRTTQNLKY